MPAIIEPPPGEGESQGLPARLAWFFGLAIASAGVVIVIAYALKALLR
jgi:hypothetical protein